MSKASMPTSSTTDRDACPLCGGEPICGGLGWLRYDVPVDHKNFGKMYRCPNNVVVDDERKQTLLKLSNLGVFADKRFETFEVEARRLPTNEERSLRLAYEMAVKFAQEPQGWLLIEGTYGCGKTHLAAAIGNVRLEAGDVVMFITVPDLLDHLRATYGPSSEASYDSTFERVRNAQLLILDDMGVENPSSWAQEKLFQLFNHRYAHELPTVVTTNAPIEQIDARIRSRLLHADLTHHAKIIAPDYRSFRANEDQRIMSKLNLYSDKTFASFVLDRNLLPRERENLGNALEAAMQYAEEPQGWLVLMGGFGTGKTHLAAAIANHLKEHSMMHIMFLTVPDLMDYLRMAFDPAAGVSFDDRFQEVRGADVLVLDDLGTENATSWAKEKLFQIIDYRYVTRRATIITTGKAMEEIDARIRSRILDDRGCHVFAITTESYATRRRRR